MINKPCKQTKPGTKNVHLLMNITHRHKYINDKVEPHCNKSKGIKNLTGLKPFKPIT